jgi:predicted ArsR family transcriptional regulator
MIDLSDRQAAEYFRRSYTAVDGLWFMKVEESYGFEAALQTDEAVWRVLPKIQARAMKAMANLENGMEGLYQGITTRLFLEGFDFRAERDDEGFSIFVRQCPWRELMVKSGRKHLSETVSNIICNVENSVWASEFGDIKFRREARICNGSCECLLRFTR